MDEGDRAPLVDSDFPEDPLPEKSANMVQVETRRVEKAEAYKFCMTFHNMLTGRVRKLLTYF